jgi:hypothetical protein
LKLISARSSSLAAAEDSMSSATAEFLSKLLEGAEENIKAINTHLVLDPPDTSEQILILRELQESYRKQGVNLRKAIREFE